jgi:hypothetical protein
MAMENPEEKEDIKISREELLEVYIRSKASMASESLTSVVYNRSDGKQYKADREDFFKGLGNKQWFRMDNAVYFKSENGVDYFDVVDADKIEAALKELGWEEIKDYQVEGYSRSV